jgi:NTP pyrophosphatase (non-canonical NTP hydrolase)
MGRSRSVREEVQQETADEEESGKAACRNRDFQGQKEKGEEMSFAEMVMFELQKVRSNHPPIHSFHEGYAILLEEVDELWDECRKKPKKRCREDVLTELVQIASVCQRMAEDLRFISKNELFSA